MQRNFKYFKKFVDNYFKNSDQNIDVSNTKAYEELMEMVDNYWDHEQTKDMLEAWIKDYFDHDQIGEMYRGFIEQNMNI